MKTNLTLLTLIMALSLAVGVNAQSFGFGAGDGTCTFIDENGDGFNDLAPDADGDGIPNGLDPDYVPAADGSGNRSMWGKGLVDGQSASLSRSFAAQAAGMGQSQGKHYGPGDGTGLGVGPADGTGFGPGLGTGICDGTGLPASDALSNGAAGRRGGGK